MDRLAWQIANFQPHARQLVNVTFFALSPNLDEGVWVLGGLGTSPAFCGALMCIHHHEPIFEQPRGDKDGPLRHEKRAGCYASLWGRFS